MVAKTAVSPDSKVLFNEPVDIEIKAPVPPARAHDWSHPEVTAYCKMAREAGYSDGAIVVRRAVHTMDRRYPRNWGIVTNLQHYRGNLHMPYVPLTVKWFDDGKLFNYWHDDLLLVHKAISSSDLDSRFKEQLEG